MSKSAMALGDNVAATMSEDGILHIVVDTKRALRRSKVRIDASGHTKGGQNVIIASTGGNSQIPGTDIRVGLNAYRPPRQGE